MDPGQRTGLVVAISLGLLVGSGVGALAFGAEMTRLRIENHALQEKIEAIRPAPMFGQTDRSYPATVSAAEAAGYAPVHWGSCEPDAGYHYDRTKPGEDGPHLLFASDGTFLGYKFLVDGHRRLDLPDPWTFHPEGHPGAQWAHWDLYVFVRDPTGACG